MYRIIQKLTGTGNHIRIAFVITIVLLTSAHPSIITSTETHFIKQSLAVTGISKELSFQTPSSDYSQIAQVAIGQSVADKFQENIPWGKAKQIDEHTWTIKIQNDAEMGSTADVFAALNTYRQSKGVSLLAWSDTLSAYAQSRADYFTQSGKLDSHAGFRNMMADNGFEKMGFNALGENSSFGYRVSGVHLIEWVYAGDKPHDDNQLKPEWTHVGIGINATATNLVFGGRKL